MIVKNKHDKNKNLYKIEVKQKQTEILKLL